MAGLWVQDKHFSALRSQDNKLLILIMLISTFSREVNEDNVLIRNILGEFEDSLKYVSKPTDLTDAMSGVLSPVFSHRPAGC